MHNSLRAQELNQPQPKDLDRLTARHWTQLGLQEIQPGVLQYSGQLGSTLLPSIQLTVRSNLQLTLLAVQLECLGDLPSKLWGIQADLRPQLPEEPLGDLPSKPWDLQEDQRPLLPVESLGDLPSKPWDLQEDLRPQLPETWVQFPASEVRSVEPRLTAPTRDQEP